MWVMTTGGFKYLIVAIDDLTKWVKARAIKDLLADTVAKFVLEQYFLSWKSTILTHR